MNPRDHASQSNDAVICAQARARIENGDVRGGLDLLNPAAERGSTPAQVYLGWICERGLDGVVDVAGAREWYERAARAGDYVAEFYLGVLLLRVWNDAQGIEWLRHAASRGYAPAYYRLARLYESGVAVPRSEVHALENLRMAASRGHPFAQRAMAIRGLKWHEGVAGFVRALKWFVSTPLMAIRYRSTEDENLLIP